MNLDVRLPLLLRQLRLPTVAGNYARYAQEASQSGQGYEEYLLALLNEEVSQRDINRRKRLIREGRFPVLRTLDELDFSVIPSLSKIKVLQLADGEYIQQCENIALIGGIGTGNISPSRALEVYGLRMKIEESFRDMKSLLDLDKIMNKKRENMKKMVALLILAYSIGLILGEEIRDRLYDERKRKLYSGLFILLKRNDNIIRGIWKDIMNTAYSLFNAIVCGNVRTNV